MPPRVHRPKNTKTLVGRTKLPPRLQANKILTRWNRLIIIVWSAILGVMLTLWTASVRVALGCTLCAGRQGIHFDVVEGSLSLHWFRRDHSSPPEFLVDPWTLPKGQYILTMAMMPSARPGHEKSISLKPIGSITWGRGGTTTHLLRAYTPIWFLMLLHTALFALQPGLLRRHYQKKAPLPDPSPQPLHCNTR